MDELNIKFVKSMMVIQIFCHSARASADCLGMRRDSSRRQRGVVENSKRNDERSRIREESARDELRSDHFETAASGTSALEEVG